MIKNLRGGSRPAPITTHLVGAFPHRHVHDSLSHVVRSCAASAASEGSCCLLEAASALRDAAAEVAAASHASHTLQGK